MTHKTLACFLFWPTLILATAAQSPVAGQFFGEPRVLLSGREDIPEKQLPYQFLNWRSLFFSADGGTLYIQRTQATRGLGVGFNALPFPANLSVWDVKARKKVQDIAGCQAAALSPDGKSLALIVIQTRRVARLVDVRSGKVLLEADLPKQTIDGMPVVQKYSLLASLAFAPDGKSVALLPDLQSLIWDLRANSVTTVVRSPATYMLGFTGDSQAIVFISFQTPLTGGDPFVPVPVPVPGELGGMPVGAGKIYVWDLARGAPRRRFGDNSIRHGVLAPNGKLLATAMTLYPLGVPGIGGVPQGNSAKIQLWDVTSGKAGIVCDSTIVPQDKDAVPVVSAFPAFPGFRGFELRRGGLSDLAFSADGRLLASALATDRTGVIQLWDPRSGRQLLRVPVNFRPQTVALSRDGKLLAAAGTADVRVWEVPASLVPRLLP